MDMRNERAAAVLHNAVCRTFENLAFAEVTDWRLSAGGEKPGGGFVGSAITLRKPEKGAMAVFLLESHCRELVQSVYGIEVSPDEENPVVIEDFINEFLNTIAGRFAADLAGEVGKIGLGLPVTVIDPTKWLDNEIDGHILYRFDADMNPGFCALVK
jgi:hypothetical protein